MEGKKNINTMSKTELQSLAYQMICEMRRIEQQLKMVEEQIIKRIKEQPQENKKGAENDKVDKLPKR